MLRDFSYDVFLYRNFLNLLLRKYGSKWCTRNRDMIVFQSAIEKFVTFRFTTVKNLKQKSKYRPRDNAGIMLYFACRSLLDGSTVIGTTFNRKLCWIATGWLRAYSIKFSLKITFTFMISEFYKMKSQWELYQITSACSTNEYM